MRNLPSGDTVEVEAEGEKQQLEHLLEHLKTGPETSMVEQIEVRWSDYRGQFTDFSIRH